MDICKDINSLINEHLSEIIALRATGHLKDDNSFVSDGDLLCERLIFDYLKSNLKNYIVISEESENDISEINKAEYVVTIDPIDGTENFVSGLKEWGLGVSIYKNMVHFQSMIALPELHICLCTGDKIEKIKDSRICGLSSYMTSQDFEMIEKGMEYRIMGCCMYNMYNVIRGSYAQFLHLKGCYSWDILPGMNLALEHGIKPVIEGEIYKGEFLTPNIRYRFSIKCAD
ncbi:MAG: hypothetical protein LBV11_04115 [Bacillus cereus]|jgi:myo-inositol-1(or 4)-monophosphatase|nr:hypothetical protein [Bacillus cereus]